MDGPSIAPCFKYGDPMFSDVTKCPIFSFVNKSNNYTLITDCIDLLMSIKYILFYSLFQKSDELQNIVNIHLKNLITQSKFTATPIFQISANSVHKSVVSFVSDTVHPMFFFFIRLLMFLNFVHRPNHCK